MAIPVNDGEAAVGHSLNRRLDVVGSVVISCPVDFLRMSDGNFGSFP